jgi:hypothetical protein
MVINRPNCGAIRPIVRLGGNTQYVIWLIAWEILKLLCLYIKEREQKQVKRFGKDDSKSYTR